MQHYKGSITVGRMQDELMGAGHFDHLICFGALNFLSRVEFNAMVARMFMLARKTVAFDVEDVPLPYIESIIARHGEGMRTHNNVIAYKRFGTPKGWKKALEDQLMLFHSPAIGMDIHGTFVRFERA